MAARAQTRTACRRSAFHRDYFAASWATTCLATASPDRRAPPQDCISGPATCHAVHASSGLKERLAARTVLVADNPPSRRR